MKTTPNSSVLFIVGLFMLTTSCKKNEAVPEFEQENAPYTAEFTFKTKSQQFATDAQGKNIVKVVLDGTGSFSFAPNVTFTDEFDLVLATGVSAHKVTFTTSNGDKIYTTMTTQIGKTDITGTTSFSGGTGRFAKIKGGGPNAGPPVAAGAGSWKETGGQVTF